MHFMEGLRAVHKLCKATEVSEWLAKALLLQTLVGYVISKMIACELL